MRFLSNSIVPIGLGLFFTSLIAGAQATMDFGDAPVSYQTLLIDDGPRHDISPGFVLGQLVDVETNGYAGSGGYGDDVWGIADDEDGFLQMSAAQLGRDSDFGVYANQGGRLDAWIDWNADGDFADAGEQMISAYPLSVGLNLMSVSIPLDAAIEKISFIRFRLSASGGYSWFGYAPEGEVEDHEISFIGKDYGDAPTNYPVLEVNSGAEHFINPAVFLGSAVDADPDGQESANADADDSSGVDDEDGISFGQLLVGGVVQVNAVASTNGALSAWIDFNRDGDWIDPGEMVATNVSLFAGGNNVNIQIDSNAVPAAYTYARFRFSTVSNLFDAGGQAFDGEVEDYRVWIDGIDYGDAPDVPYPTRKANMGASHRLVPGIHLGASVDAEGDGQPNGPATGDDMSLSNDADGVRFLTPLFPGLPADIEVIASTNGTLAAWIDFEQNGDWSEASNNILLTNVVQGVNRFSVPVPGNASNGHTYARFRFLQGPAIDFFGAANNGEVEDYRVAIGPVDFGDAQEPPYPTTIQQTGAFHFIDMGAVRLGTGIDGEPDGQPSPGADGDGLNDDGIFFLNEMAPCDISEIFIDVTNGPGFMDAWIDWNADGDWNDAKEQVATNWVVTTGGQLLPVNVPCSAEVSTPVAARFRVSSLGGLSATGGALDGEVEDYITSVYPMDVGDAPDPGYATTLANNGARHLIDGVTYLGLGVDADTNDLASIHADGDDLSHSDDEDGLLEPHVLSPGATNLWRVVASGSSFLNIWVDYGLDGSFSEPGDHIVVDHATVGGTNTVAIPVASSVPADNTTFARLRLSNFPGLSFDGVAPDGEVEDYAIRFVGGDLGDAPDSYNTAIQWMTAYPGTPFARFPTARSSFTNAFGPKHRAPKSLVYLGNKVTFETDAAFGQDEDGVPNLDLLADIPNQDAGDDGLHTGIGLVDCDNNSFVFTVTCHAPTSTKFYVNAWFDWNRDGDWEDTLSCGVSAPEWAVQNDEVMLSAGQQTVFTPNFGAFSGGSMDPLWMRLSIAEQKAPASTNGIPNGRDAMIRPSGDKPVGKHLLAAIVPIAILIPVEPTVHHRGL